MGNFNFTEDAWQDYLYWQTTDKNVATVDATGKVTIGKRAGETQITATTSDGGVATCKITVKNSAPDSIKFRKGDKTTISLTLAEEPNLKIGDSIDFMALTNPDYAAESGVTWSSSNSAVLEIVSAYIFHVLHGNAPPTLRQQNDISKRVSRSRLRSTNPVSSCYHIFLYISIINKQKQNRIL